MEQEEPPEETDLFLHDDGDDAEDPESTNTAAAQASEPFPTVAAEVARAERFLYLRCAYGQHPPKPRSFFRPMQDRRCACIVPMMRCCARVRPLSSRHDLGGSSNSQMRALKTEVEFPSTLRFSHWTMSACSRHVCVSYSLLFCSISYSTVKRATPLPATLGISTCTSTAHVSRLFQHVPRFPGVKPSSAMNVNAWICTCATDSNLVCGFSEATVILTAFSVRAFVLGPER